MSISPLPVRSISIGVPSIGCERLNASLSEALIAAGGSLLNVSVAFKPPGTASANIGLPTKGWIAIVMKPADRFEGGTVNETANMIKINTATNP